MRTITIALLTLLAASASLAQIPEPQRADNDGPPVVYFAHSYDPVHPNQAGLDDRISVHVQNFGKLLEEVNGNCANIVLYLDTMPIKGLKPESCDKCLPGLDRSGSVLAKSVAACNGRKNEPVPVGPSGIAVSSGGS